MTAVSDIWVYLAASPLLWLTLTLLAYALTTWFAGRLGQPAWANPVALSVALLIPVLALTGTPYRSYFEGAQFVHFLLGPTTVALAVPLYRHRAVVRRAALPMLAALLTGAVVAAGSALLLGHLLGLNADLLAALAPKSATAPIAMAITERLGGLPSLSAAMVVLTGLAGVLLGLPWLRRLTRGNDAAYGMALGIAAHGIGTARAFQRSDLAGTFAGIALGLTGLLTALLVPPLWALFWMLLAP